MIGTPLDKNEDDGYIARVVSRNHKNLVQRRAQRKSPASPATTDNAFTAATEFLLEFSPHYNRSAEFRNMVQSILRDAEQTPDVMYVTEMNDSRTKNALVELVKGYKPVIDCLRTPACTLDTPAIDKLERLFKEFMDACEQGLSSGGPAVGC